MNVFVAGGNGLVGSAILREAPQVFRIFAPSRSELDLEKFHEVLDFFITNKIQAVIFAAAKVGGILANSTSQFDFLLKNLTIQNSVIEAAKFAGVRDFIFLGSSCAYPRMAVQPIKEEALMTGPLEPTNEAYALAKIAGIKMCRALHEELGLNYFTLMPTNLYGFNDNFDRATAHVPAALLRKFHEAKLFSSSSVEIWGTGEPMREFMSATDLARACWFFISRNFGGEIINIGTGFEISISDFAILIARIVGYEGEILFNSNLPNGTPRKILDCSKAHSYGWSASINLEEGIRNTYEWFSTNYESGGVRGV